MSLQGVKDKEVIAVELAAAEAHIGNTAFGQMLLRRYVLHNLRSSIELSTCPLYSSFSFPERPSTFLTAMGSCLIARQWQCMNEGLCQGH